jgi:hypothetical protein
MSPPYPHEPGARDTDTSREAADGMASHSARLQSLVFDAIYGAGTAGLTSEECADRLSLDSASAQPRTTELRKLGRIRDSGIRRRNRSGKNAIVWTAL